MNYNRAHVDNGMAIHYIYRHESPSWFVCVFVRCVSVNTFEGLSLLDKRLVLYIPHAIGDLKKIGHCTTIRQACDVFFGTHRRSRSATQTINIVGVLKSATHLFINLLLSFRKLKK